MGLVVDLYISLYNKSQNRQYSVKIIYIIFPIHSSKKDIEMATSLTKLTLLSGCIATALTLTACGSDATSNAVSQLQNGTIASPLKVDIPNVGQKLIFGTGTPTVNTGTPTVNFAETVADKKYYARFAYCNQTCDDIRIGEMNFTMKNTSGDLSVSDVTVDKRGKITFDKDEAPLYTELSTGKVGLASSNLTLVDKNTNSYRLQLTPANSTDDKLPNADIRIYFNDNGVHVAGADDHYLFVAQQLANQPIGWGLNVAKSAVAGIWNAVQTDENLTVTKKSTSDIRTNEITRGASPFIANDGKTSYNGYYKNLGAGYVFGYTDDGAVLKSDAENYDGIDGVMLTAPDNQFGIGYDAQDDKSFLLFR